MKQISQTPLKSNITYTAQESINSYRIDCEDGVTLERKNHTINIIDANAQFTNIALPDSSYPLKVSWDYSGQPCINHFNGTLAANNTELYTGTTNQTELTIPYNITEGSYNLTITAENIAGHITSSGPFAFRYGAPDAPALNGTLTQINGKQTLYNVSWEINDNVFPSVKTIHLQLNDTIDAVAPEPNFYTFTLQNNGQDFLVKVKAENDLGNSTTATLNGTLQAYTSTSSIVPSTSATSATSATSTTTPFETLIKTTTTAMMTKATEVTNSMSSTDTPIASNPAVTLNSGSASAIAQVMMVVTGIVVALGFVN